MRSSDAYRLGVDIGIDARNGANPFDVVARRRHARPDIQRNPFSHLPMAIRQSPVRVLAPGDGNAHAFPRMADTIARMHASRCSHR